MSAGINYAEREKSLRELGAGPTKASITEAIRPIFGRVEFVLLQGDAGVLVVWYHPTMGCALHRDYIEDLHEEVLNALEQIMPFGVGRSIVNCPISPMWHAVQTMADMGCSLVAIEGILGIEEEEL